MRILGIDPGTKATGWGVVDRAGPRCAHVAHGTLAPRPGEPLARRLAAIGAGLRAAILAHRPDVAVIERVFVAAGMRSALVLAQVRGVALAAAGEAGLPVVEYAPRTIKKSVVGTGTAAKPQVQGMVQRLLRLPAEPGADAADALAAAICHGNAGPLATLPLASRRRPRGSRAGRSPGLVVRRVR